MRPADFGEIGDLPSGIGNPSAMASHDGDLLTSRTMPPATSYGGSTRLIPTI